MACAFIISLILQMCGVLLLIQAALTVGVLLTMARWAVNHCSDVMLLYVILILREDYLIFCTSLVVY